VDRAGFLSCSRLSPSSDLVVLSGAVLARGVGMGFRGRPRFRFGGSRSYGGLFADSSLISS
jgi:hypothetical protein